MTEDDANEACVYLVTENYGDWTPVGVYESLDDAKALDTEGDWHADDRGVMRNRGNAIRGSRDLFIQVVPFKGLDRREVPPE